MKLVRNKGALLSAHFDGFSLHLGPHRDPNTVYKVKDGREVTVECDWIWGRATEQYDHCLEYFGLGPLFLAAWVPGRFSKKRMTW